MLTTEFSKFLMTTIITLPTFVEYADLKSYRFKVPIVSPFCPVPLATPNTEAALECFAHLIVEPVCSLFAALPVISPHVVSSGVRLTAWYWVIRRPKLQHQSPSSDAILSHLDPDHILRTCFRTILFNISLPYKRI